MSKPSARFARSVFVNQLLISAVMLLLILAVALFDSATLENPLFFMGLLIVFVATALAALVPWRSLDRRIVALLPALDILATVAVRTAEPAFGAGLFLIFPVIWLARDFGVAGASAGVISSTLLLWTARSTTGAPFTPNDLVGLLLLPITLTFVSVSVHATTRRSRAQRELLRQQTGLVETALERARRQEQLLDKVLNSVDFAVVAFDRHGAFTTVNDAHRRLLLRFGASHGSFITDRVYAQDRMTLFSPEDRPMARAMKGQSFDDLVVWFGDPGDDRAAYAVSARRVYDSAGEWDGGVVVMRDVTAELQAVQTRDDLVAAVSHELRSPLTSMLGYLDLALDDPTVSEEGRQRIEVAYRNSERLLRIVGDLLATSSEAESQTTKLQLENFDLGELIDEAVEAHQVFAEDQHIVLGRTDALRLRIDADPLRVRQVLDNLISNGIKYNVPGGRLDVSILIDELAVSVAVTDTGEGISERDQSRLFERYFRTEHARNSAVKGTGLGLGISRTWARAHGGDLTVSSDPGYGSTFVLRLPTSVGQTAHASAE